MALLTSLLLLAGMFGASGCATSPTGRSQFMMMSDLQMAEMGRAAFVEMKGQMPVSTNSGQIAYVRCISNRIISVLTPEETRGIAVDQWEVELFEDDSANAFALPGGRIGVNTGLLAVAENQSQLAAVIGHEVGHVIARHSNERMTRGQMTELGMVVASGMLGGTPAEKQGTMAMLGMTVDLVATKPFSRTHESEADHIGLDLMARAGFNPLEAIILWQNMAASAGAAAPPEILSTHPSHSTRIDQLGALMPEAQAIFRQVASRGGVANCR
jgi:predicted Zn-dependent protease